MQYLRKTQYSNNLIHRLLLPGLIYLNLFLAPGCSQASEQNPLEPVDTSSPRATLTSILTEVDKVWQLYRDSYWQAPSKELEIRVFQIAARALRTLDLSQVAPSARNEVGYEAGTALYETLSRIPLPHLEDVPDATDFINTEATAQWTLPDTDITIARVTEGPRKGEFLFSPTTVERAKEFYLKTRSLPYQRDVPIKNTAELRQVMPGWWIAMATIDRLPAWAKQVVMGHAVWKWIASGILLLVIFSLLMMVHRFTRYASQDTAVKNYTRRMVLPVFILLLMPVIAYLLIEQINLINAAAKAVLLTTQTIKYLLATWVAWLGSLLVAEIIISSPRMEDDSLNAQLLRLSARIIGIALGLTIIFYGANQIGLPLVGVLTGVGVGGLAIALAAQDSLKNLLGSLMIFMDQPYKPGQRIVVQDHDGIVEQIGLRSTKIRMLDGPLTSIPNEKMASMDIENIGRRSFIRRVANIRLAYDTPMEKLERAVEIVKNILQDHEGMRADFPPRVYFNDFNLDSLNLLVYYWYHPPEYWQFLAFNERVNLEIMRQFQAEGIRLAVPTSKTYFSQADDQPL